jgi:hypothetical protein
VLRWIPGYNDPALPELAGLSLNGQDRGQVQDEIQEQ